MPNDHDRRRPQDSISHHTKHTNINDDNNKTTIYRPLTVDYLVEVADIGSTAEISQGEVAGGAVVAAFPPPTKASKVTIPADMFCEIIWFKNSQIVQALQVPLIVDRLVVAN